MQFYLDFEKPLVELEQKIMELKGYSTDKVDFSADIKKLEKKTIQLREEIFANLTRWQRTQLARHINRPFTLDYIEQIFTDWFEVHGDRNFRDDPALVSSTAAAAETICSTPAGVRRYSRTARPVSDTAGAALTQPLSSSFWSAG